MISDAILPRVISFTPVSDRPFILKLEERFWDIVIINCYAPTEQGNNEAASFDTASDCDKWRGLVEAAKNLKGP